MSDDLPPKPTDVDRLGATPSIQPGEQKNPEMGNEFKKLMDTDQHAEGTKLTQPTQPSPMDVAKEGKLATPGTPPTAESIRAQMQTASGSLGDIKTKLNTKKLKLKQSQKYLLRNKLSSASKHIRDAVEKAGVDPGPPVNLRAKKNPIAKFLDLVSDGQNQLNEAAKQVQALDTSGKSINAGQLLLVQVKLQKAQQELDYTSTLLGKAVDMVKTLFNVQI